METRVNENGLERWETPLCPFMIEYSPRVLDDVRLAIIDAFFSLPRGGAEIGGILLGKHEDGRVLILDYASLDCEHALGPSFTLSPHDHERLAALLAATSSHSLKPVGWYHSHTRSEVFLSAADIDVHKRYFPEPWQVALVLKPHTFQPARAGFFFREADGSIHGDETYREFVLPALPMKQVPTAAGAALAEPPRPPAQAQPELQPAPPLAPQPVPPATADVVPPPVASADAAGQVITVQAELVFDSAAVPATTPPQPAAPASADTPAPITDPLPAFATEPQRHGTGLGLTVMVALAAALAIGTAAFETRELWWPHLASSGPPPALGLSTLDSGGQLQIRWNRGSPALSSAAGAVLEILDGSKVPHTFHLTPLQLRAGALTWGRRSERVDVSLGVESGGRQVRETASFVGGPPPAPNAQAEAESRRQHDDLAREVERLGSALDTEKENNRKLAISLQQAQTQLQREQKRRLRNQSSPVK